MPARSVFRWPEGRGWLILSGGPDGSGDIRARALGRAAADGAVAYIPLAGGANPEQVLEDMEGLGAPAGYLVDVTTEDDATITSWLRDAGIVVIETGQSGPDSRSALIGAAIDGVRAAYESGAVVLAEGYSAMAFGAWVVRDDGSLVAGLDWLEGGLIVPGITDAAVWARDVLLAQTVAYVVGIAQGSALALGPDGEVEVWGRGEVTVALGRGFTSTEAAE